MRWGSTGYLFMVSSTNALTSAIVGEGCSAINPSALSESQRLPLGHCGTSTKHGYFSRAAPENSG